MCSVNEELLFLKRLCMVFILAVVCFQVCESQSVIRPKVAVVLSGGGAKGFAHIGVLKVLEQEGIPIDIIVGTSMGSIVGGLYSIGYSADEIRDLALTEDWQELLSDRTPREELDQYSRIRQQRYALTLPISLQKKPAIPNGLINGQNIINLFCGLTANVPQNADFSKFPVSFACVATDLETGEEVVLNSGFLPTALFSSMAIPGVFAPGEHNGHLLVDGGLVNNFPSDVAKMMGADIIIGVDISADLHTGDEINSINEVMDQLINFYVLKKNSVNRTLCDIMIRPDIEGYSVSSFYTSAVDTLYYRGLRAATASVDELRKLKSEYSFTPTERSRALIEPNSWEISNISVSGNYSVSENYLSDGLELDLSERHSYVDIKRSINNLYGTGNFKRAYFNLEDATSGKRLNIVLDEKKSWDVNVGIRANTRSAASVVLNTTKRDYRNTIGLMSLTADISSNPKLNLLFEIDDNTMPRVSLALDGMYKKIDVHPDKDITFSTGFYYAAAKLYSSQRISRYSSLGSGIKQDFYRGKRYSVVGDTTSKLILNHNYSTHLYSYLTFDNLDNYYFPEKGTALYSEVSVTMDSSFSDVNFVLLYKMRNIIELNSSCSLLLNVYGRSLLSESTPHYLRNFAGGCDYEQLFIHHLPFYGLPALWSTERFTFVGLTGLRVNIAAKHYLSLVANFLTNNDDFINIKDYETIVGGGLTYAYNSFIGPLELTVGYSDEYKKPIVSANIGLWF